MKINLKEHLSLTEKRNAKSDLLFSRKRNRRRCAAFRNTEKGLAFILPSFAGVCIFWLIPYVDVIRRSFCGAVNGEFVGIENYRTIFANKAFRLAAGNTLRFFGVCVPLLVVLSLIIAVLLAGQKRFTQILKSFFLLPMAIPVASVVLLWRLLFDDQGLLNHLLHMLSVQTTDWMNTGASFYVLVISYIWRNLGYDVVLWMAGLSAIPAALYEAAKVDGQGSGNVLRRSHSRICSRPFLRSWYFLYSMHLRFSVRHIWWPVIIHRKKCICFSICLTTGTGTCRWIRCRLRQW